MDVKTIYLQGRATQATDETPAVTVSLPATFGEASEVWGSEICEKIFADAVEDAVMRFAKSRFTQELPLEVIQGAVDQWQPGKRANAARNPQPGKAKVTRLINNLNKLSEEDKEVLRARLAEDPRILAELTATA